MEKNREHKIDAKIQRCFLDVKQWILDHRHVIMGVGLLMLFALGGMTIFRPDWQTFLFVTDKGRFQWVGLSAAAAGIGLVVNSIQAKRKFKADLISKSRIDWIKETQKEVAKFIQSINKLCTSEAAIKSVDFYKPLLKSPQYSQEEKDEASAELTRQRIAASISMEEAFGDIGMYSSLLDIKLSDTKDNLEFIKSKNALQKKTKEIVQTKMNNSQTSNELDGYVTELATEVNAFKEVARKYFKREWENAKLGQ